VSANLALEHVENGTPPDLILSDVVMPGGLTGFELAYRLRERFPKIPIVLMTGYSSEIERARAEHLQVLHKPGLVAELESVLRAHLPAPPRAGTREPVTVHRH
jgi:CheY-like chemotaxis protein